jgi:hypothetical protein
VDWHLMVPPLSRGGGVDDEAPLSKWFVLDRFESAAECKRASGTTYSYKTTKQRLPHISNAQALAIAPTECIATDQPRLKGNKSMSVRHAAALALVGWYLMVPPVTPEGLTDPNATLVNGKAPISQWVIFRVYDSAEQCQRARRSGQRALVDAITANPELLTDRAQYGLRAMELLK